MMKIAILTSIEPNKENKGPTGSIWEIQQTLVRNGIHVNVIIAHQKYKSGFFSQLSIMGLCKYAINADFNAYDVLLVYPDVLLLSLPKEVYCKAVVFAPDATSLVRYRKFRAYSFCGVQSAIKKLYQYVFFVRFVWIERHVIPLVKKYLVVGKNDRRWLKRVLAGGGGSNVVFLRHPLLSNSLNELVIAERKYCAKRFVFSGDLSRSYVGNNIVRLAICLENKLKEGDKTIDVVVVGKKNKWVYDIIEKCSRVVAKYIDWVDSYQEVCHIGIDVHCVPLLTGAGTKNRVVTAIANGLDVVSTPIGVENILISLVNTVHVCRNMEEFAKSMIEIASEVDVDLATRIHNSEKFRTITTSEYEDTLLGTIR